RVFVGTLSFGGEQLERDLALQAGIPRCVDFALRANAQASTQLEAAELRGSARLCEAAKEALSDGMPNSPCFGSFDVRRASLQLGGYRFARRLQGAGMLTSRPCSTMPSCLPLGRAGTRSRAIHSFSATSRPSIAFLPTSPSTPSTTWFKRR